MKLNIEFESVAKQLDLFNRQSVTVGIIKTDGEPEINKKAAKGDYRKNAERTTFSTLSGSTPALKPRKGSRSKNITLRKLGFILDDKAGVFSNAIDNASNKDLIAVANEFATFNKTPAVLRRLRNAARAVVRNPILNKKLGVSNKASTAKRKKFNHYAFATATFFKNIKAAYKSW